MIKISSLSEYVSLVHHVRTEVYLPQASLTILCLQLVADGGQIDLFTLYKIKLVVARALGFHAFRMNITPQGQASSIIFGTNMGFTEISFGCITPLLRVLDSFQSVNLPVLSSGQIWSEQALSGLIGDVFVDIVVKVFETESFRENATELPYIVMRGLLECMLLIIVKVRNKLDCAILNLTYFTA